MRPVTILLLGLIIAVAALSGCGGDGVSYYTLAGNSFPTALGTNWAYRMDVTTHYLDEEVTAQVRSTRQVSDVVPAAVGTSAVQTVKITDYFPAIAVPDVNLSPTSACGQYLDYLFSAGEGGLRDWCEYFTCYDTDGDGTYNRIVRTASGPPRGLATPVPDKQPFLRNPIICGQATTTSVPLTTIPFFTNNDTLSGTTTTLKVQYRSPDDILGIGTAVQYVTYVQTVQASIDFQGLQGPCTGTVTTNLAKNYGPVTKDIDLEFRLGGLLRFHILMTYIP